MGELTSYLAVRDAREAIAWYVDRRGAEVTYEPIVMPDGLIGHTELTLDGALWMMADEQPELRAEAPDPGRGAAVTLHVTVDDVDGLVERVVAAGATLDRGPEDNPAGRVAVFRDPFGHRWFLERPEQPA